MGYSALDIEVAQSVQTQNVVVPSAGTQTATSGTVAFANSNGISFGMSGSSQITASYTVPSTAGLISALNVSAGTTSNNLTAAVFSNSNGVSFGLNGSTVTGSVAAQTNQSLGLFAIGNTTQNSSTTLDARSLSLNFLGAATGGFSNGSIQVSVGAQTNQTEGIYLVGNTTAQSSSSTYDARSLSVQGTGGVSVGWSNGSLVISGGAGGAAFSAGVSTDGNTAGTTGTVSNRLVLVGLGNVSLSQSTGAGGATVSINGNQTLGVYAAVNTTGASSSTTIDARSLSFAFSGGISGGISGGSVLVSVGTLTSLGIYAASNTTGVGSSSTIDARSLSFQGAGGVSVGWSGGSYIISGAAGGFSAGMANSGNTQGVGGAVSKQLLFVGSNGITLSQSTAVGGSATITILGNTNSFAAGMGASGNSSGIASAVTGQLLFVGSNGITLSEATAVGGNATISVFGNTAQGFAAGVSTGGNIAGITGTVNSQVIFVGGNGITLSQNTGAGNATITISGVNINPISRAIWPENQMVLQGSGITPGNMTIQYFPNKYNLSATRFDIFASISASAFLVTGSTAGVTHTIYAAIYSRTGGTLSSLSATSGTFSASYSSNNGAFASLTGPRMLSLPLSVSMTPGDYYVAVNYSSSGSYQNSLASSAATVLTLTPYGGGSNNLSGLSNFNDFNVATASTNNFYSGMGVYSATTTGIMGSIALSNIQQSGIPLQQANIAFQFQG